MTLLEFAKSKDFRDDTCYFVSTGGLGDTYYLCALLYAFIETYNLKVAFCVKESHKVVFDMFAWEYVVLEDCGELSQCPKEVSPLFSLVSKIPQLGRYYPAHNMALGKKFGENFREFYCNCLDVDYSFHFKAPSNYPILSKEAESKILSIAPFNKIILFIPDARSTQCMPLELFTKYIEMLHKKGYKILLNSLDKKYAINNVIDLDLSLSDAVALTALCNSVYAVRSGFCDIIASRARNLHVFYESKGLFNFYSFSILLKGVKVNEYYFKQTKRGYKVRRLGLLYLTKLKVKKQIKLILKSLGLLAPLLAIKNKLRANY